MSIFHFDVVRIILYAFGLKRSTDTRGSTLRKYVDVEIFLRMWFFRIGFGFSSRIIPGEISSISHIVLFEGPWHYHMRISFSY